MGKKSNTEEGRLAYIKETAKQLSKLEIEKNDLETRIKNLRETLVSQMKLNESIIVTTDEGIQRTLKKFKRVSYQIPTAEAYKEIKGLGIKTFLRVVKVSVESFRALVGQDWIMKNCKSSDSEVVQWVSTKPAGD